MRVIKDTPLEIGWITWAVRPPQPSLVVVVKGTFALGPQGALPFAEEQELPTGDMFWDDDPELSARYESDMGIIKPRGEVLLVGTWRAPGGKPVTQAMIRMRVGSVKKQLALIGDRYWKGGMMGGVTEPVPFTEMPLCWERAFGGPKVDANPVGSGIEPVEVHGQKLVRLPNIEDPGRLIRSARDKPKPAGAFPIPRTWKARTSLMGTYTGRYQRTRWPWFPEDFQWEHFNAAPQDQRIRGFWKGDEEIALQGVHPDHRDLTCRLPGISPRVFLDPAGESKQLREVGLALDTIVVDADAAQVYCLWRGTTECKSETLEEYDHVFVVHEPIDRRQQPADYRAWFERKLAEEAAEEEQLEAEPMPAVEPEPPPGQEDEEGEADEEDDEPTDPHIRLPPEVQEQLDAAEDEEPPEPPSAAERAAQREQTKQMAREQGNTELLEALEEMERVEAELAKEPEVEEEEAPEQPEPSFRELILQARAEDRSVAGSAFADVDLSELDLSGIDLSGCELLRANLRGTNLDGANLSGANLSEADVTDATLRKASLVEADLTGLRGERPVFDGADLSSASGSGAQLAQASFREAKANGLELSESSLEGADFRGAVLDGADLSGATLDRADFSGASMVETSLSDEASVREAVFEQANVTNLRASEGSNFYQCSFKHATATGARFNGSKLQEANFSFADLQGANFDDAHLVQAVLMACEAPGAKFQNASLVGANLGKANLYEAMFESANLHHADLRGANLYGAETWRANLEQAQLELANVTMTKLA